MHQYGGRKLPKRLRFLGLRHSVPSLALVWSTCRNYMLKVHPLVDADCWGGDGWYCSQKHSRLPQCSNVRTNQAQDRRVNGSNIVFAKDFGLPFPYFSWVHAICLSNLLFLDGTLVTFTNWWPTSACPLSQSITQMRSHHFTNKSMVLCQVMRIQWHMRLVINTSVMGTEIFLYQHSIIWKLCR